MLRASMTAPSILTRVGGRVRFTMLQILLRSRQCYTKDCVHQLVHKPIRTMVNNRNDSEERICLFAVESEQPQTAANLLSLPYKEGVAGLNPASPTYKSPTNSGASPTARWRSIGRSGPIWA